MRSEPLNINGVKNQAEKRKGSMNLFVPLIQQMKAQIASKDPWFSLEFFPPKTMEGAYDLFQRFVLNIWEFVLNIWRFVLYIWTYILYIWIFVSYIWRFLLNIWKFLSYIRRFVLNIWRFALNIWKFVLYISLIFSEEANFKN